MIKIEKNEISKEFNEELSEIRKKSIDKPNIENQSDNVISKDCDNNNIIVNDNVIEEEEKIGGDFSNSDDNESSDEDIPDNKLSEGCGTQKPIIDEVKNIF